MESKRDLGATSEINDRRPHINIDRDDLTGKLQLSINDSVGGYRLAGPKYRGESKTLLKHFLSERDVAEIRAYLKRVK